MSPTYIEEIEAALKRASPKAIEDAAQALLMDETPLFLPIGGTHDLGRDAEILKLQDEVNHRFVAISVEKEWPDKIRRDAKRIKDAGFEVQEILYCTTQEVPESKQLENVRSDLRDLGIELKIADRKWWATKLQQDGAVARRVKRELLHLAPFRPSPLRTADEYEEYLSARQHYVLTELVGRDALIQQVAHALKPGVAVIVHGNLGSGKTRVAVEAAKRVGAAVVEPSAEDDQALTETLLSGPERFVALDDAQNRLQLVRRLAGSRLDPAIQRPPALLLVSWTSSLDRVRAAVSDAYAVVEIEVPGLEREQLATILREHFKLDDADRGAVLTQSQGLPLFAVLGALALGSGASREQVARSNPLEVWFERAWPRHVPEGDAELLGILAMRGALRLIDSDGEFTVEAKKAADAAGLRPQQLRAHLDPYLDAGLAGYEDDHYAMMPDALAQLVIKRLCFSRPPLVTSAKALVEAATTSSQTFGRIAQLFDRIADELREDAPRRVLVGLIAESVPKPDAEIGEWMNFVDYTEAIARFDADKAIQYARQALTATPKPATEPLLRDAYTRDSLRRKVRDLADAALGGSKTAAEFRASVSLLLDLSESEPLIQDLTGGSQSRAPTMHHLFQLSERFDPRHGAGLPYAIRGEIFAALREWWKAYPETRADRVALLLTRLLDPGVFGSYMDPDKPHQFTLASGFLDPRGYPKFANEIADVLEEVLKLVTDEGGRGVLSQVDDIVRAARGISRAFNQKPNPALKAAARDVACRVLGAVATRFAANPAFLVRVHQFEREAGCPDIEAPSPEEGQVAQLFARQYRKDWRTEQQARAKRLEKLAEELDTLSAHGLGEWIRQRAEWAQAAGLDVSTEAAREFAVLLGKRRPSNAATLARSLVANPVTAPLAELTLVDVETVWDKGGQELLESWINGTEREQFALWALLGWVHSSQPTPKIKLDLLLKALKQATPDESRIALHIETILIRLAGGPDAAEALSAALNSRNATVRRVAVLRSCLTDQPHAHHIKLRPEDRAAFEAAFEEMAKPLGDDQTGGSLDASEETFTEVINQEPELSEKWLRGRLRHLARRPGRYIEPFSHGEYQALQGARGKLDVNSLLDDYAALAKPSFSQKEAYEKVLRLLVADLAGAIAERIERGDLTADRIGRLLRLVPEGPGWPELIVAASKYISEDDLMSAIYDATFYDQVWSGSFAPIAERQAKFFEEQLAQSEHPVVARIGRKLAEHYRKKAERERREDFRDQYER